MKIYGIFDPDRSQGDLACIIRRMSRTVDFASRYQSEYFATEGIAIGWSYSQPTCQSPQPIWNEERTRFIVNVGRIFDYAKIKELLLERGHDFNSTRGEGEFILHAYEEWGDRFLEYLNGVFVFALYDTEHRTLMIVNDRYGMKPIYYYHRKPSFTFASNISAVLEDDRVKREIDWDAWRDFFSYRYVLGTKTFFKNIRSLRNATILTVTNDELLSRTYWSYTRIGVNHHKTEEEFVETGARLIRRAIEGRCVGLRECIVLISGGYDSRCIASTISRYTKVRLETFTTRNFGNIPWGAYAISHLDAIMGGQVARRLGVPNTYVPTPSNLWQKYFVRKILLVDGMCHEHLWMLPLVDKLQESSLNFDGIGGDVLLKGLFLRRDNLMHTHDLRRLAEVLNSQMRSEEIAPEIVSDLFYTPVRERLQPNAQSLLEELGRIGEHENIITIFFLENRTRNAVSLLPNNIVATRVPSIFPFLDNDLVEFSLTIPPLMKIRKQIYFRILKRLFPDIMRIPSSNFHLPSHLKESAIRQLLMLVMQLAKWVAFTRISYARKSLHREAMEYLTSLVGSLRSPPFVNVDKVRRMEQHYVRHRKDPSPFLVPIAEFCVWYNTYLHDEEKE